MNALESTSTRPYLIRALYDWCTDNGLTPYVAVLVDDSVQVPREYVKNGEIVLNISFDATSSLKLGNEFIEFKARFAGTAREIMVPVNRVIAIYARENGQGMAFPVAVAGGGAEDVPRSSPLSSVPAAGAHGDDDPKVVQLVAPEPAASDKGPDSEPPRPPTGPRPALKRVK
jgi:stringent starvation protein B